jgi:hypothetical protein
VINRELVKHEEVAEWLGYDASQKQRIRDTLDQWGVPYRLGKDGRVCTTVAALNSRIVDGRKELRPA